MQAQAPDDLQELTDFFNLKVKRADWANERESTQINLDPYYADESYMEMLGDALGLEWHDIKRIPIRQPDILINH